MDNFGYFNARVAGRSAGAGIRSSARWATERRDGWPPADSPLPERYELRYIRERMNDVIGARFSGRVLSDVLTEVDVATYGDEIPTPKRPDIPTARKRSRKQTTPKRLQ